jgi:hypothetical protein
MGLNLLSEVKAASSLIRENPKCKEHTVNLAILTLEEGFETIKEALQKLFVDNPALNNLS